MIQVLRKISVCTFLITLLMPAMVLAQPDTNEGAFLDKLVTYLDLSDHKSNLEQGGVIHTGLLSDEQLPEEIVTVGAMFLVKGVSPDKVINTFMDSEIFKEIHNVKRYAVLSELKGEHQAFEQLAFRSDMDFEKNHKNPRDEYNLGRKEALQLKSVELKSAEFKDAKEIPEVRGVWLDLFGQRLESFVESGVNGIEAYVNAHDKVFSPAQELSSALQSYTFLDAQFPLFRKTLLGPVKVRGADFEQKYFWLETQFEDKDVWALSTELRLLLNDSALAADMHFYVSRGYYSMLTLVGVVPYGKHSLVFAVNHTYTAEVLGFAAKLKRKVGRKRVAKSLAQHLERVRMQFEKNERNNFSFLP